MLLQPGVLERGRSRGGGYPGGAAADLRLVDRLADAAAPETGTRGRRHRDRWREQSNRNVARGAGWEADVSIQDIIEGKK
ncbi:hypothetical protein ACWC4J_41125, partial [Streptomyces sp. NPDC001356]